VISLFFLPSLLKSNFSNLLTLPDCESISFLPEQNTFLVLQRSTVKNGSDQLLTIDGNGLTVTRKFKLKRRFNLVGTDAFGRAVLNHSGGYRAHFSEGKLFEMADMQETKYQIARGRWTAEIHNEQILLRENGFPKQVTLLRGPTSAVALNSVNGKIAYLATFNGRLVITSVQNGNSSATESGVIDSDRIVPASPNFSMEFIDDEHVALFFWVQRLKQPKTFSSYLCLLNTTDGSYQVLHPVTLPNTDSGTPILNRIAVSPTHIAFICNEGIRTIPKPKTLHTVLFDSSIRARMPASSIRTLRVLKRAEISASGRTTLVWDGADYLQGRS
jgi:hypothetical protein